MLKTPLHMAFKSRTIKLKSHLLRAFNTGICLGNDYSTEFIYDAASIFSFSPTEDPVQKRTAGEKALMQALLRM